MSQSPEKLQPISRAFLLLSCIGLVLVLFVPMWRIELDAPQYPEGLVLQIFPNKIAGDVEIVNGLNHYIGMKTLHTADFMEFTVLPYIIASFSVLCLITFFLNRKKVLYSLLILFIAFGLLAMYDFWRWEYAYGHELNPEAAIQIPGMAYQPPLIGFKQLLNFGAYSIPDTGGWIFICAGGMLLLATIIEWRNHKKQISMTKASLLFIAPILFVSSCKIEPEPIHVGKDNCDFCKMTISDQRFAAEIVTTKGKVYKFDDLSCAAKFYNEKNTEQSGFGEVYVSDYAHPNQLILAKESFIFSSRDLRSPMNGNFAAFAHQSDRDVFMNNLKGVVSSWSEVIK